MRRTKMAGEMRLARVAAMAGAVLALLSAGGCTVGTANPNIVRGSGKVITEARQVSGVNEVVLTMSGDLSIVQDATESLAIEGEDNIVPLITTEVSGKRLTIGVREGSSFSNTRPLRIRLAVSELRHIQATGSGNVEMDGVEADRLHTETNGSGNVTVRNISTNSYSATTTGSGNITASGAVDRQEIACTGSGNYEGRDLQSRSATVEVSGSGNATLRVSDTLDATVSGSGSVWYIGSPAVEEHDSGNGEIAPAP
jgi:hypothetical protein